MRVWLWPVSKPNSIFHSGISMGLLVLSMSAQSSQVSVAPDSDDSVDLLPSEALINFMLEFDNVDDQTFNLILQRGLNDVEEAQSVGKQISEKRSSGDLSDERD
jgi:hypothetical protein